MSNWETAARSKYYLLKTSKNAAIALLTSAQAQIRDLMPAIRDAERDVEYLEEAARFGRVRDTTQFAEELARAKNELDALNAALTLAREQLPKQQADAHHAISLANTAADVLVRLKLMRQEDI